MSLAILIGILAGCAPDNGSFEIDKVHHVTTGDDSELNVLTVSDIMFDGSSNDAVRKEMITGLINRTVGSDQNQKIEPYELIVVNGNTVNGSNNGELMTMAVEFFDSFEVPWAITIGKSDVTGSQSKTDVMNILKKSVYGVMSKATYYDESSYLVDVFTEKDRFISTLYFIDTSVECSDELVNWYANTVTSYGYAYADKDGQNVNSMIYMNTPLSKLGDYEEDRYTDRGEVTVWENSKNFEKKIIELASTRAVFVGCDTLNDYALPVVNNIRWAYSRSMYFPSNVDIESEEFKKQSNKNGARRINITDSKYVDTTNINLKSLDYLKPDAE